MKIQSLLPIAMAAVFSFTAAGPITAQQREQERKRDSSSRAA